MGRGLNDEQEARALVQEHYGAVLAYCRRHGPRGEAEDLAQEAFLRFARQSSYGERGSARGYLLATARNLCIDASRRQARSPLAPGTIDPSEREIADGKDPLADAELALALAALDEAAREIIALRFQEGLSVAEIAAVLAISRFAAHRRLRAALNQVRDILIGTETERSGVATGEQRPRAPGAPSAAPPPSGPCSRTVPPTKGVSDAP